MKQFSMFTKQRNRQVWLELWGGRGRVVCSDREDARIYFVGRPRRALGVTVKSLPFILKQWENLWKILSSRVTGSDIHCFKDHTAQCLANGF